MAFYQYPSVVTCPRCGTLTALTYRDMDPRPERRGDDEEVMATICMGCHLAMFWLNGDLVYPAAVTGPPPALDMSDLVREIYEEARAVASVSPRAAAALLRVAVEMLVDDLEPGKGNLFTKIGRFVKRGLDPRIQKMLDTVRFYGNDGGVHPGEINLKEQPETLDMLMFCVNQIIEQMVTIPRQIDEFYNTLPDEKRKAIEWRDGKNVEAAGRATEDV